MKALPIIKSPDQRLRQVSKPIAKIDKKTQGVLDDIRATLVSRADGVGLAAIQIGHPYRVFGTYLPLVEEGFNHKNNAIDPVKFFINPRLIRTSPKKVFTKEKDHSYTLEGCLSLPGLYAAIPRFEEIELEYQEVDPQTQQLSAPKREVFRDYYARNIQHEFDHLMGVLFTDYVLGTNIILYRQNPRTDKLEEITDLNFLNAY